MVIALLTIPPAIAGLFVKDMKRMMVLSTGLSALFSFTGLMLSFYLNLTSGATIILVAAVSYLISFSFKQKQLSKTKISEMETH